MSEIPLIERVANQLRPVSNRGYDYVASRGIKDPTGTLQVFSVRWRTVNTHVKEEWIVIPVWNTFIDDKPIGLYLRSLDSTEHMRVYRPGILGAYYGLTTECVRNILKLGRVIVAEGLFDALSTFQPNTLSSFTNRFSTLLIEHLSILKVPVVYVPDNDKQGAMHLNRIKQRLADQQVTLTIRRVPSSYKDLNEFLQEDSTRHGFFVKALNEEIL